jgi:hypothetical protein
MTPSPDEKYFSSQFSNWPTINADEWLGVRAVFDSLFVKTVTLVAK